ncbi:hypothetical protein D3C73_904140 [compost metagenome]
MVPVTAVGQPADPVDHVEAHRRGTDIPRPAIVLPANRHAGAGGFLMFVAATTLGITGAKGLVIFTAAVGRETAGIQLHGIGTEKSPPVVQRHVHLQHGVVRFVIGDTAGAARTPVIVIERDVNVLLTVQIRRIRANTPLEPVVARVVACQIGITVVILRHVWRNAAGHHRLFIILLRQRRLALVALEPGRIAVNQRLRLACRL